MKLTKLIKLPIALTADALMISPIIYAVKGILTDASDLEESPFMTVELLKDKDLENDNG